MAVRRLVLVLGDQLDPDSPAFEGFDPRHDAVWMAENHREATHVWCHQQRLVMFFAAMRHFRDARRAAGVQVHYHALGEDPADDVGGCFGEILVRDLARLTPERLVVVEPGDYRVWQELKETAQARGLDLEVRHDDHFYTGIGEFNHWAAQRKSLLLETFYRRQRRQFDVLMADDGTPTGGEWNFDRDNRKTFGAAGPGSLPTPPTYEPSEVTRGVMAMVKARYGHHPGRLDAFAMPVTPAQAVDYLDDFLDKRLGQFGPFEDAMWGDKAFLYHSRLSAPLNLKLLNPRACVDGALKALEAGRAPINSVEGFVRQILGWREFIRGVYWWAMPGYGEKNALGCEDRPVPAFFWHGETEMNCVAHTMAMVIEYGYSHHIHRLMVMGLFAQLLGVHPQRYHQWHMAMYLDAIDWVSLPNALGMSQYGDGGVVGSKPYCATGNYIKRMGNYCKGCRYDPAKATGDDACPFTTLYWDFLARHRPLLAGNNRMGLQLKNLDRKDQGELKAIRQHAVTLRRRIDTGQGV
ncbi:MAG: cryptochrome/photolyase family protein [Candidatus Competibacterales bacterium]